MKMALFTLETDWSYALAPLKMHLRFWPQSSWKFGFCQNMCVSRPNVYIRCQVWDMAWVISDYSVNKQRWWIVFIHFCTFLKTVLWQIFTLIYWLQKWTFYITL